MKIDEIKKLAQIVEQFKLSALEVNEGDYKVRLERAAATPAAAGYAPAPVAAPLPAVIPEIKETSVDFNNIREIKSPMVGVFYAAPSPDAAPFAKVGQRIQKGDILCIVEAMKLMNEIPAEASGEIVDICVSNGDVVEFGQTLFKIV